MDADTAFEAEIDPEMVRCLRGLVARQSHGGLL